MMRVPKLCCTSDGRSFITIPRDKKRRREYFGKHGTPEAETRYRQWVARYLTGTPTKPRKTQPMLAELAILYLEHAADYYRKNGQPTKEAGLVRDALKHLLTLHATTPVDEFAPPHLIQVQQSMIAGGYSRKTINNHISRCKRFVRWCCAMGHAPAGLYHQLTTVDGLRKGRAAVKENPPVQPVPWSDVTATLPYVAPVIRAMVRTQFYCGMRPQDVTAMRDADIDTSGRIWLYTPTSHKTEHLGGSLVKAIPQVAQTVLQPYMDTDGYLFRPADSHRWHAEQRRANRVRTTPLYPSEARRRKNKPSKRLRERFSVDSYRRAIKHGLNRALDEGTEIPHWHPNQLRHAVATEISKHLSQQAAQRWLGHARLDTTSIYAEKQLSELVAIAAQLDQHWG